MSCGEISGFMKAMNIPVGLKEVREASTSASANVLLSLGWELITIEGRSSGSAEGNLLYVMGWSREERPPEPTKPERTRGNLADDARQ